MKLALDAYGGDHAPRVCVEGAVAYAQEFTTDEIFLVGDSSALEKLLREIKDAPTARLHLVHATQVVEMNEHGPQAIRQKKDSSLRKAIEMVREDKAQAFVSAGNSGAVMAGALLLLGRIKGVSRPAFAALLPSLVSKTPVVLTDAGANTTCEAPLLAQFAVLGEAYARTVHRVEKPKVALLSNGEEEEKGTEVTRETLSLLKKSNLRCVGYIEGNHFFEGRADVVVADGFSGNIALKTMEGSAKAVGQLLKTSIADASVREQAGAFLLQPMFIKLKKQLDYAEYGGAPMLGVDGVGIVAHGRSSARAIRSALRAARVNAEQALVLAQQDAIAQSAGWLEV